MMTEDSGVYTYPSQDNGDLTLTVVEQVMDPITAAFYVHKDLVQVRGDWEAQDHIGPIKADERFGDVESWGAYVQTYHNSLCTLLTWNTAGLRAVLDYHEDSETAGRCKWLASMPFVKSGQWQAWAALANGQAVSQRTAVERLEDLAEDIIEPNQADVLAILRSLRANVTANAATELRPDGTTNVTWTKNQTVSGKAGEAELPSTITIGIPVLRGDKQATKVTVRIRASVDNEAHLTFRFTIINAERVLEFVYGERVDEARNLLGPDLPILRSAD